MSVPAITKLAEVLGVEERVYLDLRMLLAEERGCMLELDAESLYELATKKEILAEEGRLAGEARNRVMSELARSIGLSETGTTLSQLCVAMGEEAAPLRAAQSRLLAVVSAVVELSEANQRLGGDRLTDVQTTLQLLGRLAPNVEPEASPRGGHLVHRSA